MHIKNPVGDFSPTGFVEQPLFRVDLSISLSTFEKSNLVHRYKFGIKFFQISFANKCLETFGNKISFPVFERIVT